MNLQRIQIFSYFASITFELANYYTSKLDNLKFKKNLKINILRPDTRTQTMH